MDGRIDEWMDECMDGWKIRREYSTKEKKGKGLKGTKKTFKIDRSAERFVYFA